MQTVFRFESKDRQGPYMKEAYAEWCELDFKNKMPSVIDDFAVEHSRLIYPRSPWLFGCPSKEDIKLWFSEEVQRRLIDSPMQFSIAEYQVEEFILSKSKKQVMFLPKEIYE